MSILRNERGGAGLVYVIMISLVLMVVTPAILNMTANDSLRNVTDKHTLIASNLAVSGMESFIAYLDTYTTGDRLVYFNNYPGFMTKTYTTPEGINVLYSLTKAVPIDNKFSVTMTATVGSGNLIRTKTISYTINVSEASVEPTETTVSTGSNRTPIKAGDGFYVQGKSDENLPIPKKDTNLKNAIGIAITYYESIVTNEINARVAGAEVCICTTETQVRDKILNSSSNPVIIEINQNIALNGTYGTDTKPVILIINTDNFNPGNNLNLTVTGDLIVMKNITVNNNPNITIKKAGNLYGNFYVMGTLDGDNMILSVPKMLYTGNLVTKNNTEIEAGIMVVKSLFDVQNHIVLTIGLDLLAGSINVKNNATITASAGDILVENNFSAKVGVNLTAGGVIAAGGDFEAKNNPTISTGGATSSLISSSSGAGGGTGGGTRSGWNPIRQ